MRLILISHRFPPNFLGGADIYTAGLALELRKRGHIVSVMCVEDLHAVDVGKNRVIANDTSYKNIPVRRLHFDWAQFDNPYGNLYVINNEIESLACQYYAELKPDVVHVTSCDYVTCAVITAAQKSHIPVVLSLTGKWLICPQATLLRWDESICGGLQPGLDCHRCMFGETRFARFLNKLPVASRSVILGITWKIPTRLTGKGAINFIRAVEKRNHIFPNIIDHVDIIITPSLCHRQVFSACGLIPAERMIYSAYGHNLDYVAQGSLKYPSPVIRFGYTGQLFSHKGADTLIEAFQHIPKDTAKLLIYGHLDLATTYGRRLKGLADGNPNIEFRGRFIPQRIGSVLAEIDVLVVPSKCVENTPVTIAEAFAACTPVIGSDTCGIAEQIDPDVNGLLFRRCDVEHLAAQMLRFIQEPELLERMRAGIRAVRTVEDEAEQLERIYLQLVRGKSIR